MATSVVLPSISSSLFYIVGIIKLFLIAVWYTYILAK